MVLSQPEPRGTFGRIYGGFTLPGGLIALLIGLVTYTSSFIAEIVRAGLQSVDRGQKEASRAVGLSAMSTLRNVTFPQALKVIIPPLISQYLNLTKNSSLAGAIGYSDLTNVAKTMTQTAPAVSIFILIMLAYVILSLTYSLIGNFYNRRLRLHGR
jgi:general L-amino acid transport system permease protein